MHKTVSFLFAGALVVSAATAATFSGVITDNMCGKDHAMMKVSPDPKCVVECVKHGSRYVLLSGKDSYTLNDQKSPEKFAGQKVFRITGTLFEKTKILKVDSISLDGK